MRISKNQDDYQIGYDEGYENGKRDAMIQQNENNKGSDAVEFADFLIKNYISVTNLNGHLWEQRLTWNTLIADTFTSKQLYIIFKSSPKQ